MLQKSYKTCKLKQTGKYYIQQIDIDIKWCERMIAIEIYLNNIAVYLFRHCFYLLYTVFFFNIKLTLDIFEIEQNIDSKWKEMKKKIIPQLNTHKQLQCQLAAVQIIFFFSPWFLVQLMYVSSLFFNAKEFKATALVRKSIKRKKNSSYK